VPQQPATAASQVRLLWLRLLLLLLLLFHQMLLLACPPAGAAAVLRMCCGCVDEMRGLLSLFCAWLLTDAALATHFVMYQAMLLLSTALQLAVHRSSCLLHLHT
jgi:hypothetical protein